MDVTSTIERLRQVGYSAVVSDCCDQVGLREQTLSAGILPISPEAGVLVGLARPVRSVAVEAIPEHLYAREIAFIDSLGIDDVVVATVESTSAFWGELSSTAAVARGPVDVVIDGLIRYQRRIALS